MRTLRAFYRRSAWRTRRPHHAYASAFTGDDRVRLHRRAVTAADQADRQAP
jgi:hypothetical protein